MEGAQIPWTVEDSVGFGSPMTTQVMMQLTSVVSHNTGRAARDQVNLALESSYQNMSHPFKNFITKMEYRMGQSDRENYFYVVHHLQEAVVTIENCTEFSKCLDADTAMRRDWIEAKNAVRDMVDRIKLWGFQKDRTTKVTWGAFIQTCEKMDREQGEGHAIRPFIKNCFNMVKNVWGKAFNEYKLVQKTLKKRSEPDDELQLAFIKNMGDGHLSQIRGDYAMITTNVKTGKVWRYLRVGAKFYEKEGFERTWREVEKYSKKDSTHMVLLWSRRRRRLTPLRPRVLTRPQNYDRYDRELSVCMERSEI